MIAAIAFPEDEEWCWYCGKTAEEAECPVCGDDEIFMRRGNE